MHDNYLFLQDAFKMCGEEVINGFVAALLSPDSTRYSVAARQKIRTARRNLLEATHCHETTTVSMLMYCTS